MFLGVGSTYAQQAVNSFRFNWETGEISLDMQIEDMTWELNGTTLRFTETSTGRDEGLPGTKPAFRPRVVLNKDQLSKLKTLLAALESEPSASLLPKGYQGTLLSYSLRFGMPPKSVTFEAPQLQVDAMNRDNPAGTTPAAGTAANLLLKFDALRDALVRFSS